MSSNGTAGDSGPVKLESPCSACGGNEWDVYEPGNDAIADMWFECLTESCHGVRFASGQVQADTEAVEADQ